MRIRLVYERWVGKYTEPWSAALGDLKSRLEHSMEKVFEIYIRTTAERLWEAAFRAYSSIARFRESDDG